MPLNTAFEKSSLEKHSAVVSKVLSFLVTLSVMAVSLGAGLALAQSPVSDDFDGNALNTNLWTSATPAGGSVTIGNGHVNLAVPGGSNHDAVVGGDNSVRILQRIGDTDFDVAAKFDSAPGQQYQGEGILVQQDSGTYLRLEFSSDGSRTVLSANSVVGGSQQGLGQVALNNASAPLWLRVQRSGSNWTLSYSNDGVSYTTAGSYAVTINVSAIGPYAWNYNIDPTQAPAITAAVDYFYNLSSPSPTTATPTFSPAATTFPSSLSVALADATSGATIYYTTDGSAPTTTSRVYATPITISATTTITAFAIASGDILSAVTSATYTLTPNTQPGGPISDDFNASTLNTALWTATTPGGGSVTVSNGHANLGAPAGSNHDPLVGGNNSVRILQTIANSDFDVTAKFDSAPTQQYEGEGILVQQDSGTYLRLEFSSDGNTTVVSGNYISAGSQQGLGQLAIGSVSAPLWLRVQRSGNNWTASYSSDGSSYSSAVTFSQSLAVSALGPYAWNYNVVPGNSPPITAAVDYFYNLGQTGGTNPPVISNIKATPGNNAATITWQTDESSTNQVNWGTTVNYGSNSSNNNLVTTHSASLTNLTCGTTYDFDVSSTNSSGQSSTSGNQTFFTSACGGGGGPVSDSFDGSSLNTALWAFINPAGDAVLTMNGTAATLNLPQSSVHDPWTGGNGGVRLMQNVPNSDFQVQVRFQSDVEIGNQEEGIIVQQDSNNFLRFDFLCDGTSVRLFSAGINGGNATIFVNNPIPVTQAPIWLQVQRSGNNWVESWSTDGQNFFTGAQFSYAMTVSSIGPYAGNAGASVSTTPAFTAVVDYFFNTAQPVSNVDGPPPFQAVTIEANPPSTLVEKALADIEGTGRLNPVAGFEAPSNGGIYWYGYPASGQLTDPWLKHPIVSDGNAYEDMLPLDVNGDGAVDIIASYTPPNGNLQVVWFENPRGNGGNPATSTWTMHSIGNGQGEDNLVLADLDGDGKIDVVTAAFIFFQNSPTSWTQVQYNSANRGSALLDIGSGNGSINLVGTSPSQQYNTVWFENPREHGGNARTDPWVTHFIAPGYPCNDTDCPGGDYSVATFNAADLNGDGKMDVVMGQSEDPGGIAPPPGGLLWFEAPADRRNGTWIRHVVDANYVDTHCVRIADMDHNGTLDLVTSEQDQSTFRRVSVFYNDGLGNFSQEIVSNAEGHQTTIGDVQGNGAIDIFNSGHGYFGDIHPLQLFMNPVR